MPGGGILQYQTSAASVSALSAISPFAGVVLLTPSLLFGIFSWVTGNYETEITNDPLGGIYVPWSGDSAPGASGAWVRQWRGTEDWCWWGAVPDGVVTQDQNWNTTAATGFDNYDSFVGWQTSARYRSSLGLGIYVEPSPGIYCWTEHSVSAGQPGGLYWTSGISKLHINGRGQVTLQNLTTGGHPFPIASCGGITTGYLIEQTVQGATSFTCITPTDAANFTTGQWIMLGSLDVQFQGYPSNLQQYQYVQVSAPGNTSTGAVTIQQQIKDVHRTDYPDYNYNTFPCGAARAWTIGPGLGVQWDIDHIYEGLQVNNPLGGGSPAYCTITGRRVRTIDWVGCGFSESAAGNVSHLRPIMKTTGEPDKLVEYIEYVNPCFDEGVGLSFQSTSPRMLVIKGGKLGGMVGCAQRLHMEGVDVVGDIAAGCQYGINFASTYQSCRFNGINGAGFGTVFDGAQLNTIDGTIVTYANSTLSVNMASLGYNTVYWNVVPGMQVVLQAEASDTSIIFPGDAGVGIVTSISYNSGTGITTINIAGLPASLPSWATGKIYFMKVGQVTMRECTGLDAIRLASAASAARPPQRYFDQMEQQFGGEYSTNFQSAMSGTLVSVKCEVFYPGTSSAATFALTIRTYDSTTSNFAADGTDYTIVTINVGVKGTRLFTTSALAGETGTDAVTVNGSTVTALPANRLVGALIGAMSVTPSSNVAAPRFRLTITTDNGSVRDIVTTELFGADIGTNLPIQGLLQ